MSAKRIAVLFDAENIDCATALTALKLLRLHGTVQISRAVGNFSLAGLASWIGCARDNGIDLVLQPGLGKGKNSADIRLTIEAMDIVHQRVIDTIALVTHDGDFAPLALRLRHAGLTVMGFSRIEPNAAFRVACSTFEVLGSPPTASKPPAVTLVVRQHAPVVKLPGLQEAEIVRLRRLVVEACAKEPVTPTTLNRAIVADEPELATKLSGGGKFLKSLIAFGIVERVGSGAGLKVQSPSRSRKAS